MAPPKTGFGQQHLTCPDQSGSVSHCVVVEVQIVVAGLLPPAKGEAKSMLAPGHPQHGRVRALLEAAAEAMDGRDLLDGELALDVRLTAPPGHRLPDATNMLGGIGDVLQARSTGADLQHLQLLRDVACFHDDAQIQEVRYQRLEGAEVGYRIVIRPLDR